MKRIMLAGITAAGLIMSSAATCSVAPVAPKATHTHELTPAGATASPSANQVVTLVNRQRVAAGCGEVTVDASMTAFAQNHSEWMVDNGLVHSALGVPILAENIASGIDTPKGVVDAWMESEPHKKNILNCAYTKTGAGNKGTFWTQVFG
jgi:uncharacterized protein YkwD